MLQLDRGLLLKVHLILAAGILPVILMFMITGALYTWGVKGDLCTRVYEISLAAPLGDEQQALMELVKSELGKRNIPLPTGRAVLKKTGGNPQLEWTGSKLDVVLEQAAQPLKASLILKEASWHRYLVQLHKAKGGPAFRVYAAIFAAAAILVLLSGFLMVWQMPKYRKLTALASGLGIALFILMVLLS